MTSVGPARGEEARHLALMVDSPFAALVSTSLDGVGASPRVSSMLTACPVPTWCM